MMFPTKAQMTAEKYCIYVYTQRGRSYKVNVEKCLLLTLDEEKFFVLFLQLVCNKNLNLKLFEVIKINLKGR